MNEYLSGLEDQRKAEQVLSPEQLIARVNLILKERTQPTIHPRDVEVHMLFRRTPQQILRDLRQKRFPASISHDAMFNQCWKVAFESALACIILRNKGIVEDVVMRTVRELAKTVLPALKIRGNKTEQGLFKCYQEDANACHAFSARFALGQYRQNELEYPLDTTKSKQLIPDGNVVSYFEFVFREDNFAVTFEEKMTAIYNFSDFVTRPHKFEADPKSLKQDLKFRDSTTVESMLRNWRYYKLNDDPGWFDQKKEGNPSVSRVSRQGKGLEISTNHSGDYAGIWAVKGHRTVDVFNPYLAYVEDMLVPPFYDITGVGLWRPRNRTGHQKDAAGVAMHRLDMPMIGGISGGMGSYLIAMIYIGQNYSRERVSLAFFAAYAVMIAKGYHSFHEVAAVAQILGLGLPYKHGDYESLLRGSPIAELKEVKELCSRFSSELRRTKEVSERHVLGLTTYRTREQFPHSPYRAQTVD